MEEHFLWRVDQHAQLTAAVKAWLLATYAYTPDPTHTWGAIVTIRSVGLTGARAVETFPFTFIAADYVGHGSNLKAAIDAVVQTKVNAYVDAQDLDFLVGRNWPV